MRPTYTREGNDIFVTVYGLPGGGAPQFPETVKVAEIDEDGNLQMTKGQAKKHREGVEAFLAASGDEIPDPDLALKIANPLHMVDTESGAVTRLEGADLGIPPCPPEDPGAGDKTPAVVAWWFKHHPEEAAKRYEGRRFTRPDA